MPEITVYHHARVIQTSQVTGGREEEEMEYELAGQRPIARVPLLHVRLPEGALRQDQDVS